MNWRDWTAFAIAIENLESDHPSEISAADAHDIINGAQEHKLTLSEDQLKKVNAIVENELGPTHVQRWEAYKGGYRLIVARTDVPNRFAR